MALRKGTAATIFQVIIDIALYVAATGFLVVIMALIPPAQQGYFCDDVTIQKPRLRDTVPFLYLIGIGVGVPIVTIVILEFFSKVIYARLKTGRVPQYLISMSKLIGMFLYGLTITMTVTECLKLSVGRLRPHFIDTCRPNATLTNCTDNNYITEVTCTAKMYPWEFHDIRKSFPSGHASFSMYCSTFFIVYMESRFFLRFSLLLKSVLQMFGLLVALYTTASRVSDNRHHLADVIVGALLGVLFGFWTIFCLAKQLRAESYTEHESGGDQTTALYKEPMPCHHNHLEHGNTSELQPLPSNQDDET